MTAEHGTRRRYQTGCRCLQCRVAQSRYRYMYDRGGKARFPADPVRDHIRALLDSGWTAKGLGEAAGLGNSTVGHLMHNDQESVNSMTARALLNMKPLATVGLRGHLRALLASGMTVEHIAAAAGVQPDTVRHQLSGQAKYCKVRTSKRLLAVGPRPAPTGQMPDLPPAAPLYRIPAGWAGLGVAS